MSSLKKIVFILLPAGVVVAIAWKAWTWRGTESEGDDKAAHALSVAQTNHNGSPSVDKNASLDAGAQGQEKAGVEKPLQKLTDPMTSAAHGNVAAAEAKPPIRQTGTTAPPVPATATLLAQQPRGPAGRMPSDPVQYARQYGDQLRTFFETKNVDQGKQGQIIQAAVQQQLESNQIIDAANQSGNAAESSKLQADVFAKFQDEVKGVLGPQQGQAFIDYFFATPCLPIAQDFANRCSAQGEPISPEVTIKIVETLSDTLLDPNLSPSSARVAKKEAKAMDSAKGVLSPNQLQIFQQLWEEHPYPNRAPYGSI